MQFGGKGTHYDLGLSLEEIEGAVDRMLPGRPVFRLLAIRVRLDRPRRSFFSGWVFARAVLLRRRCPH